MSHTGPSGHPQHSQRISQTGQTGVASSRSGRLTGARNPPQRPIQTARGSNTQSVPNPAPERANTGPSTVAGAIPTLPTSPEEAYDRNFGWLNEDDFETEGDNGDPGYRMPNTIPTVGGQGDSDTDSQATAVAARRTGSQSFSSPRSRPSTRFASPTAQNSWDRRFSVATTIVAADDEAQRDQQGTVGTSSHGQAGCRP